MTHAAPAPTESAVTPAPRPQRQVARALLLSLVPLAVAAACSRPPEGGGAAVAAPPAASASAPGDAPSAPAEASGTAVAEAPEGAPSGIPVGSAAPADASATPPTGSAIPPPQSRALLSELVAEPASYDAGARRVLRQHGHRVVYCLEGSLRTQPGVGGKLTLRLSVGADGRVTAASADGPAPAAIAQCVAAAFRDVVFPSLTGTATLTAHWELTPGALTRGPPPRH